MLSDFSSGDRERSKPIYEESLAVSRAVGDPLKAAHVLNRLGGFVYTRGDYETWARYLAEAQQARRHFGDWWGYALVGGHTGKEYAQLGQMAKGRVACEEALALHRSFGDKWGVILTLWNFGQLALLDHSLTEAEALLTECLALSEQLNDRYLIAQAQLVSGRVALAQEEWARAKQLLTAALRIMVEMSNREGMINGLDALAALASQQEQPTVALQWAALLAWERKSDGVVLPPLLQLRFAQMVASARQQVAAAVAEEAWRSGKGLNLRGAVQCILDQQD